MTRIMRDSDRPSAIPIRGTDIAAGYLTGPGTWPAQAFVRFRRKERARIDCRGTVPRQADILDVEGGCSEVSRAASWVKERKAAFPGAYPPVIYCNRDTLTRVLPAMRAAGLRRVKDYRLWIATLDGTKRIPDMTGVIAVQYKRAPDPDKGEVPGPAIATGHFDESIVFDDIVGAFGKTGVGSIDIVPVLNDPTNRQPYVPVAEAHLYNQTANGTFGSFEHHVQPIDFLASNEVRAHASETGQYRVNIGFRTISTTMMNFDVYDVNGSLRLHRSFTYGPNFTLLTSPEALLNTSLAPGETIAVYPERGSYAIPFFTYTDNGTNDPTIFMPEFPVKSSLGPYDVPGVVTIQ